MKQRLNNRLQLQPISVKKVLIGCFFCLNLVQTAKSVDQYPIVSDKNIILLADASKNKQPKGPLKEGTTLEGATMEERSSAQPNVKRESFKNDWNQTRHFDPNKNILEDKDFNTHEPNHQETRSSPIWRPFYSEITLEDYNKHDCCARALKSTTWEVQDRCEEIGYQLWKVKGISFSPKTKPVEIINICYILEKKAVGNNWFYQCTTKAEAKCFDPKLPQNSAYMKKYNEIEGLKKALIKDTITLTPVAPSELTYESLQESIPSRPEKTIPDNLTIPIIRPRVEK